MNEGMLSLIDPMPTFILLMPAVTILLAPLVPAPHVREKRIMLKQGARSHPLDVFDLLDHLLPTVLLAVEWIRSRRRYPQPGDQP